MASKNENTLTLFSMADSRKLLDAWRKLAVNYGAHSRDAIQTLEPTISQFRSLLNTAYQVSILAEEGRFPRLRMLFQRAGGPSIGPFHGNKYVVEFEENLRVSVDRLRKLAPSVSPDTSYLIVEAGTDERSRLYVRGIGISPIQEDADAVDRYRKQQLLPYPYLVVSIDGPGKLTLRAGSFILARVVGGVIKLGAVAVAGLIRVLDWRDRIATELSDEIVDQNDMQELEERYRSPTPLRDAQILVQVVIERFVNLVRQLGHGALLLVCDTRTAGSILDSTDKSVEVVHTLAPEARNRVWHLLQSAYFSEQYLFGVIEEYRTAEPGRTALEHGRVQLLMKGLEKTYQELHIELEVLAQRANIDGALIISEHFTCICFGSPIRDRSRREPVVDVLRGEGLSLTSKRMKEKHYGTRHRAAFRFVDAHPHSMAIVVSQDGDVKICYREKDVVKCHVDTYPPVAEA